jgi:predicted AAA+ superfamily ATPase
LEYELHYWRTSADFEIDFVLYGPRGLIAIEVKRSHTIHSKDLTAMRTFAEDYPEATLFIFYGGRQREYRDNIQIIPMEEALRSIPQILTS